ncbi:hypothetical protein DRB96_28920 [Streptomyces sp. ICC1]|nr:hypothetical protein DRB89_03870 [Streptomyces sp. ICC4]AWZ15616.1 hypothetical protein DRB96_28920 [Streptomyces sp. ICC1]
MRLRSRAGHGSAPGIVVGASVRAVVGACVGIAPRVFRVDRVSGHRQRTDQQAGLRHGFPQYCLPQTVETIALHLLVRTPAEHGEVANDAQEHPQVGEFVSGEHAVDGAAGDRTGPRVL